METKLDRLKGDFHRWGEDFDAVTNPDGMLEELRACRDPLPRDYCTAYDLPAGSTYSDAAELFRSFWGPNPELN